MVIWVLGAVCVVLFFTGSAFFINWRAESELRIKVEERAAEWAAQLDRANRELQKSIRECVALKKGLEQCQAALAEENKTAALLRDANKDLTNETDRLRQEHSDNAEELESATDAKEKYETALTAIENALDKAGWL